VRKELPLVVMFLSGILIVIGRFFAIGSGLEDALQDWKTVSIAFACLIGLVNLTQIHGKYVMRRTETWPYSLCLLIAMWAYLILGVVEGTDGHYFDWWYGAVVTPAGSAMYGTIAFYITTAAYRAFRIRTREATVLMICAIIVMLGQAPIGEVMIKGWFSLQDWILTYPGAGARRGIEMGAMIGALAVALRILLGLERAHLGGVSR